MFYRNMPCIACRCFEGVVAHHIKTRGAGGSDEVENLMPVCQKHHLEIHQHGLVRFAEKYNLSQWLKDYGWEQCELTNRWFRNE